MRWFIHFALSNSTIESVGKWGDQKQKCYVGHDHFQGEFNTHF